MSGVSSTFKGGFIIGLVLCAVGFVLAGAALPSGLESLGQILFYPGIALVLFLVIIVGLAFGKFGQDKARAGLIVGFIVGAYIIGTGATDLFRNIELHRL